MNRIYHIAGHYIGVSGEKLNKALDCLNGFETFLSEAYKAQFYFKEGDAVPERIEVLYDFVHEDVTGVFGTTKYGHLLTLTPQNEPSLNLWHNDSTAEVHINGNLSARLLSFATWIGLGLMLLPYQTVAIHSSCVVYDDKAVMFLGESGTGKSTHTRLWIENIEGTFLLNDDSPLLRVNNGKIWTYGSPWSGKTPCYRQDYYQLKACVRLSQAPCNEISRLGILEAYAAIHPSCPPAFAYDEKLYDHISILIDKLLSTVPIYHLACKPDEEAAQLAFKTVFGNDADS